MSTVIGQAALTVNECMRVPALEQASVVAGETGLSTRHVRWLTVIEGPVDDFIAPGELVLSTGLGSGGERFADFVADVATADAAALLLAVGPDAPLPAAPAGAREVADAHGMPLVEIPWSVRFADLLRQLADRLLSARYAATFDVRDRLPTGFTDALLRHDGLSAIAGALEEITSRPVLILDVALTVTAWGPLAADSVPEPGRPPGGGEPDVLPRTPPRLTEGLSDGAIHWLDRLDEVGLPAGFWVAAVAQGSTLGFVVMLEAESRELLVVEHHALGHAAVAVAIEQLRHRAVAEAEARARGDFLWELATEPAVRRSELTTKAALLGYSVTSAYHVLLAESTIPDDDMLDEVARYLRRHGGHAGIQATRRGDRVLALVPRGSPHALDPRTLARRVDEVFPAPVRSWGLAEGTFLLADTAEGLQRAERALRVGRALHGPGGLADGAELGPFLLLDPIARDPTAQRSAAQVLSPLEDYDAKNKGSLVHTLQVFLEENGNTSAAARRLFLNRHSLMYRLRKIKTLTDCDLERHHDRFLLELSLRLRLMSRS